jgi:hypothetical protein
MDMWTLVNASYGVAMGQRLVSVTEPRRATTPGRQNTVMTTARYARSFLARLASVALGMNLN